MLSHSVAGCCVLREHKLFHTAFDPHGLFTAHSQSPPPATAAQFNVPGLVPCLAGNGTAWSPACSGQWWPFYTFHCSCVWPGGGGCPVEEQNPILYGGMTHNSQAHWGWNRSLMKLTVLLVRISSGKQRLLPAQQKRQRMNKKQLIGCLLWKEKYTDLSKIHLYEITPSLYALSCMAC